MSPSSIDFFSSVRVTGIMDGISDPRLDPVPLVWDSRVPDVPAVDEEVTAKYVNTPLIADIIADDAKAVTYTQGRFQYQSHKVPNIKMGIAMNQALLNALERIRATGGVAGDDVGFFTNRWMKNVADAKYGVRLRKEVLKLGMLLDSFTYDRLGIKLSGITWGMYSDLKVTVGTGWENTNATALTDIQTVRQIAKQRYGINLNRATMSTPAFRAMIAQTEFQNQVKNVAFSYLLGAPAPAAPLQNDATLVKLAEMVIGGAGDPFIIELDDRQYWSQDNTGATTANRLHTINKVLLTSTANDGNSSAYDFASCPVTEAAVAGLMSGNIAGGSVTAGRGIVGYTTLADPAMNPPGLVTWAVTRGFPRKHMNQASAVLTVGTLSETFSTTLPTIL